MRAARRLSGASRRTPGGAERGLGVPRGVLKGAGLTDRSGIVVEK